jgi:hypothetical protein
MLVPVSMRSGLGSRRRVAEPARDPGEGLLGAGGGAVDLSPGGDDVDVAEQADERLGRVADDGQTGAVGRPVFGERR